MLRPYKTAANNYIAYACAFCLTLIFLASTYFKYATLTDNALETYLSPEQSRVFLFDDM